MTIDVIVFAPHPDDETLACGGVIAKRQAQGKQVLVVFMTDGSQCHQAVLGLNNPSPTQLTIMRQLEAQQAVAALGLPPGRCVFLGQPDTELKSTPIVQASVEAVLQNHPEVNEVYFPHEFKELNADHVNTGVLVNAALSALRFNPVCYRYVVWNQKTEGEFGYQNAIEIEYKILNEIRVEEDISEFLPRKNCAMQCHRSQLELVSADQRRPVVPKTWLAEILAQPREVFWMSKEADHHVEEVPIKV